MSVEGHSYSLTWQKWVPDDRKSVDDAIRDGEEWIRGLIVSATGNGKYRSDKAWRALDWGGKPLNHAVDDVRGELGKVVYEGFKQSFKRVGYNKWVRDGALKQLRFSSKGELE